MTRNCVHFVAYIPISRHLNALRRFWILLTNFLHPKNYRTHLAPFPASCNSPPFRYPANSRSRLCLFL